ncbi:hypothetical protein PFISCL1PPCAC_15077, partial [Pristionchus fissidentatus]
LQFDLINIPSDSRLPPKMEVENEQESGRQGEEQPVQPQNANLPTPPRAHPPIVPQGQQVQPVVQPVEPRPTALITCATGKIGMEIAKLMAVRYDLTITGNDEDKLTRTIRCLQDIEAVGIFHSICVDLRNLSDVSDKMYEIRERKFNVVVLCASGVHSDNNRNQRMHDGFRMNVLGHYLITRYINFYNNSTNKLRFILIAPNAEGYKDVSTKKFMESDFESNFDREKSHMQDNGWNNYTRLAFIAMAKILYDYKNACGMMIYPHDYIPTQWEKLRVNIGCSPQFKTPIGNDLEEWAVKIYDEIITPDSPELNKYTWMH